MKKMTKRTVRSILKLASTLIFKQKPKTPKLKIFRPDGSGKS
jgi:hypothetical protein